MLSSSVALTVTVLTLGCGRDADTPSATAKPSGDARGPTAQPPAGGPDPNTVTVDARQLERLKLVPVVLQGFRIEMNAPGRIAFNEDRTTPVFTPYAGRAVRLVARPGDRVQGGDVLFEIDTPELVQAESDLIAAYAATRRAGNQLELARRAAARQDDLFAAKAVAQKDWEQAQTDLRNAENDLRSAEGVHSAARDRLRVFGKSDAEIRKIEEERRIDRLSLVRAPLAGTITARKVGPGQYVKPDTPEPLFTIADISTMWLLANVYESDIAMVQVGQPVEVRVTAYPNDVFRARITYVAASVDPVTHRIAVRAEVANPGGKLKPEMFASFRILTTADVQAPAVPASAIIREGDTPTVWVASGANAFVRRPVTLGLEQQGSVQVVSGVAAGDRVVAQGALFLSNIGGPGASTSSGAKTK